MPRRTAPRRTTLRRIGSQWIAMNRMGERFHPMAERGDDRLLD
jgi:hypothetical protein